MEETLAVYVLRYIAPVTCAFGCKRSEWMDLVKTCDLPEINLIQLESLILAQSERWRQA